MCTRDYVLIESMGVKFDVYKVFIQMAVYALVGWLKVNLVYVCKVKKYL